MTLFSVSGRARVTDVKVKASASAGTEIVVGVAFRRSELSDAERSALMDYHGSFVDVELAAVQRAADDEPRPMEKLWTGDDATDLGQPERMRPGPTETCIDCGNLVGDDPDADFHTPFQGPPSPLCGSCARARGDLEDAAENDGDAEPQAWCPVGEHWLVLKVGEVCQIHDCATYVDPEAAEAAAPKGEAPEVVEADEDLPNSYCTACQAQYAFAPGGDCWTCGAKTVNVPMPAAEDLPTGEEEPGGHAPLDQAALAAENTAAEAAARPEDLEPVGARGRGKGR